MEVDKFLLGLLILGLLFAKLSLHIFDRRRATKFVMMYYIVVALVCLGFAFGLFTIEDYYE